VSRCTLSKKNKVHRLKAVAIVKGRIKKFRKEQGYSQDDMADALGIHKNTYQGYENPNDPVQFSVLRFHEICECLNCVPGNLYPLGDTTREALNEAHEALSYLDEGRSHADKIRARLKKYS